MPGWLQACTALGALLLYAVLDHFGRLNLGLPLFNAIGVLSFVIAVKSKLRRERWFWFVMALITALHVPLILLVPWGTKWVPAFTIAAIDAIDLVLMLAILDLADRAVARAKSHQS